MNTTCNEISQVTETGIYFGETELHFWRDHKTHDSLWPVCTFVIFQHFNPVWEMHMILMDIKEDNLEGWA